MTKPFFPAAERNKDAILAALAIRLGDARTVLEIGAGSGQHAVHFAAAMSWLTWSPSDLPAALPGLTAWWEDAALPNLARPLVLDVDDAIWPPGPFDAVFTANTLHFMAWPQVRALIAGSARVLRAGGELMIYGPFLRDGRHVSDGDAALDRWLAGHDPAFAIRDAADVEALAREAGLMRVDDIALPANNRLLCWRRALSAPTATS